MVLINHAGREINAKIVYYGPGLSGKTTNLECIYASVPGDSRGKMVSMKTRQDRTLFFDFLPLELGEIHGFRTRFLLYTVPGQVFYNATRKLVLKGADAVVFVADSGLGKLEDNMQSLANLEENLRENNLSLEGMPWVLQYNKRDLPQVHSIEEMQRALNPRGVPYFEAAAATGRGVYETLHAVSRLLFLRLRSEFGRHSGAGRDSGVGEPGGALAAAPVSRTVQRPASQSATWPMPANPQAASPSAAWPMPASAPPVQAPSGPPATSFPRPPQNLGGPTLLADQEAEEASEPVDYGRTIELPSEPARPARRGGQGFIRDPLRRTPAEAKRGTAPPKQPEARELRIPVLIRRGELEPGVPLHIVLELQWEP